jgi:hypothetical protein
VNGCEPGSFDPSYVSTSVSRTVTPGLAKRSRVTSSSGTSSPFRPRSVVAGHLAEVTQRNAIVARACARVAQ